MNIGALIAYKGTAKQITDIVGNKFIIDYQGSPLKIRAKDFRFIHPQFQQPQTIPEQADLAILTELSGQTVSLEELTQWLFGAFTCQFAWQSFLLVEDGLYFYWCKNSIFIRPPAQVAHIKNERAEAATLKLKQASFAKRVEQKTWHEDDRCLLVEIEKVAYQRHKYSKTLAYLGIESSPQNGHQLLLDIGFWPSKKTPFLERHRIEPLFDEPAINDETLSSDDNKLRQDLSQLNSYVIDNADSDDADDAISFDNGRAWVHIVDVASCVSGQLDAILAERLTSLYLPSGAVHMLPEKLLAQLSLKKQTIAQALSVSFALDESGKLTDPKISLSIIKPEVISYDEALQCLDEKADFIALNKMASQHRKWRKTQGALAFQLPRVKINYVKTQVQISPDARNEAKDMVAEFMIMAGVALAEFADKNNIALPFLGQKKSSASVDELTLSAQFKMVRQVKKSTLSLSADRHHGLAVACYVRITSPLRRYLDLVAQRQINHFLKGQPLLEKDELKNIILMHNKNISRFNQAEQQCQLYAKLDYLKQNNNWQGEAIIIAINTLKKQQDLICVIASLALTTTLTVSKESVFHLDQQLMVKAEKIDLTRLSVVFVLCQ